MQSADRFVSGVGRVRPRWWASTAAASALILSACASIAPASLPLGTPLAEARHLVFGPTDEFAMPNGATRLAFNKGKQTFMLDFDANGVLVAREQALTEANFATVQHGMTSEEVLRKLGRPGQVFRVGYQHLDVWNYRFADGDCVWFQISLDDAGIVTDAAMGQDPACDVASGLD